MSSYLGRPEFLQNGSAGEFNSGRPLSGEYLKKKGSLTAGEDPCVILVTSRVWERERDREKGPEHSERIVFFPKRTTMSD